MSFWLFKLPELPSFKSFWVQNNKELIPIDLNDVNSGDLSNQKDPKDKAFSIKKNYILL